MSRSRTFAALVAAALTAAACNTAKPAPQFIGRMSMSVPTAPAAVMTTLRAEAANQGGHITSETADSLVVDYGVQVRTIPIPTEYGMLGTRVSFRETEVHNAATYTVRPGPTGSVVTVMQNPIYWHPDYKSWLPGPHDMVPGIEALTHPRD